MKINLKSQKGAITLVVLVTMLFLTAFLMSMYIGLANKAQTSAETTKQIQEKYNNIEEANAIYDSYFADTEIIPIYTREHLEKIGSGEPVTINGKIYTFSPTAYYTLKNDLDLGGYYDETTKTWTAKEGDEWTPLPSTFTGTLDGLGHTITGIHLGENEGTQGIFEDLNGTIKNIYVKNSYKLTNMNGLLAGVNNGEIINCYYEKALIGLKAGDYVNYTPTEGTYKVANGANGTGYTSDAEYQLFTTETGESSLKWRILSIDEKTGKIELVSATAGQVETPLYLEGADGYNHGVDILNDLCEALYSKTANGEKIATARSMNLDDINAKTTYDYKEFIYNTKKYGDKKQLSTIGKNFMKYPNLYREEIGYGNANVFNTTGLNVSEGKNDGVTDENGLTTYSTVTGITDGNTAGTDPYITFTYYKYNPEEFLNTELGVNTAPKKLINIEKTYWLASRCVYETSGNVYFYIRCLNANVGLSHPDLFYANGYEGHTKNTIRPVVTLDTTELLDLSIGDGSAEKPWGMKY